jgi:hypothetical protein
MYQKDYILRMIEMIMKFIGEFLGLLKKGDLDEASEQLVKAYNTFLKEDSAFFHSIPAGELTDKLMKEHNFTNGHLEMLAELFNAEAELRYARNDMPGCLEFSEKSLILFEFIDRENKTFSMERINKMEALRNRIAELSQVVLKIILTPPKRDGS